MINLEAAYLKMPTAIQQVLCSLEGWHIERKRYGGAFPDLLRNAESRAHWSDDQIGAYRDRRIRELIRHCAESVPFYQRLFREIGVAADDIQSLNDLSHLPVLTKNDVQDNYAQLLSKAVPRKKRIVNSTSGTTGGGLCFATTNEAIQEQHATWWRYWRWQGISSELWQGYFGGRSVVPIAQVGPPFWRFNYPGKQILFSAYHMSPANMESYVAVLRSRRPPWLHGYPSLLALLAAYMVDRKVDLGYQVRWITTGAENLLSHQADLIASAFGLRPKQHYGMVEAVANASECELGNLHVDEDFSAVELLPNPNGEGYKIIGTNFTNLATPLLRYDVQDIAKVSPGKCSCGRPGRVLESIDGREEDYVVLKTGARSGLLDIIFKDLVNIREAQICQKKVGHLVVRVIRGTRYTQVDEAMLIRKFAKRFGEQANVAIEYVEALERSKSGKLRFVVSEIPEG